MKEQNIEFFYDPESDILEIFIGNPLNPPIFDEIAPDIFEGRNEKTGELVRYKIFNFTKQKSLRNVKVSIPLDVGSLQA